MKDSIVPALIFSIRPQSSKASYKSKPIIQIRNAKHASTVEHMKIQVLHIVRLASTGPCLRRRRCFALGIREKTFLCSKADPVSPLQVILKIHYIIEDQPIIRHKMTTEDSLIC